MPEPMTQMDVERSWFRGGKVGREEKGRRCVQTGEVMPEVCMNFWGSDDEGVVVVAIFRRFIRGLVLGSGDGCWWE